MRRELIVTLRVAGLEHSTLKPPWWVRHLTVNRTKADTKETPMFTLLQVLFVAAFGGWAAITVEDLPDYVVARQPVDLSFTVRQHGVTPLSGLRASVAATDGSLEASAAAIPGAGGGRYTATLTLPRAGEWTITIHSGFRGSSTTLLPLRAIDAGTGASPPLAEAERG